ncbi:MAG: peptide chain release factor-like protein [Candidatus Vidania fulgoroideorum]
MKKNSILYNLKLNFLDSIFLFNKNNEYLLIFSYILKVKHKMRKLYLKSLNSKKEKVYFEIRAGLGGIESNIFVEELFNMYRKFFDRNKIFYDIFFIKYCSYGFKRVLLRIIGYDVFNVLKYENGVHRVQRIPKTDKKSRVHTSTCIVEIYKEISNSTVDLSKSDLKFDFFKSSGSGGQHANKTNSAVRVIHKPTGIKVECQNERSQIENKKLALKILNTKIFSIKKQELDKKKLLNRNKNHQFYSTRSKKIRTYNFIQMRITDHLIKKNFYSLNEIFYNGKLEKIFKKNKSIKFV